MIAGLHPGVGPAHIARAALEAIAWRVADIVEAMAAVTPIQALHVDGGLTNDETLLQIQADALGLPLSVGPAEVTVLGAAMLAGVGAGVFASVEQAARALPHGRAVVPLSDHGEPRAAPRALAELRRGLGAAVARLPQIGLIARALGARRAPPRCVPGRGSRASARRPSRARAAAPPRARARDSPGSRGRRRSG